MQPKGIKMKTPWNINKSKRNQNETKLEPKWNLTGYEMQPNWNHIESNWNQNGTKLNQDGTERNLR